MLKLVWLDWWSVGRGRSQCCFVDDQHTFYPSIDRIKDSTDSNLVVFQKSQGAHEIIIGQVHTTESYLYQRGMGSVFDKPVRNC